ncbi:hypothetical protein LXL04_004533 [Taraxacum kok-saghyz]
MSATMGSSSSSAQKEMVCHCQLPVRICTSKTKEHPGKKFRVPKFVGNFLVFVQLRLFQLDILIHLTLLIMKKSGKKCKYWEWDEEPVQQSLDAEIAAIKEDVSDLKKEVLELKKKKRGHRVHIICNLL